MRLLPVLSALLVVLLTGCAGLSQFPDVATDYDEALRDLDPDYETYLAKVYAAGLGDEDRKSARNEFIERRMAVIDAHFRDFETSLAKEGVQVDFGVALLGLGAGGTGAIVSETASQILSAISGGLAGAQSAYSKSALFEKTASALLAQMHAERRAIAAEIFSHWALSVEDYPLWRARRDLEAYYLAGSIPGAILATARDAKDKHDRADEILLRKVTPVSVTDEMFQRREALGTSVDALDAVKAKTLVTAIGQAFPEFAPFVERQYPSDVRDGDASGSKAKALLRRGIALTVKSPADADTWTAALAKL